MASRVLAFFLDPLERHGLGPSCVDALLPVLDGFPLISDPLTRFVASSALGSIDWKVATEVATPEGKRIDILLTNDEHDLAITLENKLDASVNNPFESYAERAAAQHSNVISVVLAPTAPSLPSQALVSGSITYDQYFDELTKSIDEQPGDPRSRQLLKQFIENVSERTRQMSRAEENQLLSAFWAATSGPANPLGELFTTLDRVNEALRRRALVLSPMIQDALGSRARAGEQWVLAGNDRQWGRASGNVAIVYAGFKLTTGSGVELLLGQFPGQEWTGFAFKAYPLGKPSAMYRGFQHRPLEVTWLTADEAVVAEFVQLVDEVCELDPPGSGSHFSTRSGTADRDAHQPRKD